MEGFDLFFFFFLGYRDNIAEITFSCWKIPNLKREVKQTDILSQTRVENLKG